MKQTCRLRGLGFAALFALLSALTGWAAAPYSVAELDPVVPDPGPVEKTISKFVTDVLSKYHYAAESMDVDVSRRWFDEYFEQLDSGHTYFLSSDLSDFAEYRDTLAERVGGNSDVEFAFLVYKRYLERLKQWAVHAEQHAGDTFDFSVDESILIDREDQPRCATPEELEDVWRRRLKNAILVEMLAAEDEAAKKAEKEKAEAGGDGAGKPEAPAPGAEVEEPAPEPKAAPGEIIAERYARYFRRRREVEAIEVVEIFLTALAKTFDPHSAYMAPDTEEDFDISMSLSLSGIGARLTTKESYTEIVSVIRGGPADADGRLKAGDRIVGVAQDGEEAVDVVDMPLRKVVNLIRGQEGTRVHLTVLPAGSSDPTVIDIVRDKVKLTESEAKNRTMSALVPPEQAGDPGREVPVAVISLPSFYADFGARNNGESDYKSSTRDVRKLIESAGGSDLPGLILDLRGNGGGALDEAIALTGLFIESGPVVQVRKPGGSVEKRYDPLRGTVYGGPMVVLIDRLSASASEIVAAALQDYGRAVIVGEQATHGKGTVQTIFHLDDRLGHMPIFRDRKAGALKFTIQKFYRVNGGSTQVRGVIPDIVFPSYTDSMELGESHLPHVLPWDEIEPLRFRSEVDVAPVVPVLKERSAARLADDAEYRAYTDDVNHYAEIRGRKTLTLNREKRRELRREEEAWAEKIRKSGIGRDPEEDAEPEEDGAEKGIGRDLVLKEALRILGDLISLQGATRDGNGLAGKVGDDDFGLDLP